MLGILVLLVGLFSSSAQAQESLFSSYRFDDNVRLMEKESSWDAHLKEIVIFGDFNFDVGGDVRISREWWNYPDFGTATNQSQGYWESRYLFHANFRAPQGYRMFVQFKYSDVEGKEGKPSGLDNDYGDVHQIFIDKTWDHFFARLGRQEALIASGRFVSLRDGPNSRRSFDGVRMSVDMTAGSKAEVFVARPVLIKEGSFDNKPDPDNLFASLLFASTEKNAEVSLDPYVMYFEQLGSTINGVTGTEERYAVGARLQTKGSGASSDTDVVGQFGDFDGKSIFAYGFASTIKGRTPDPDTQWTLLASFFTGTGVNGDKVSTFNAFYPKGTYYGWSAQIGHPNLIAIQPGFEYKMTSTLRLSGDFGLYWRQSLRDTIYRGDGTPISLPIQSSNKRYTGSQLNLQSLWQINPFVDLFIEYSRFFQEIDVPGLHGSEFIAARVLWKF